MLAAKKLNDFHFSVNLIALSPLIFSLIPLDEDAVLEVRFCADPLPEQLWHLGETGDNMILAAGSRHKRFVVNTVRKLKEDCYISTLRILDVEQADSTVYQLRLTNSHGTDMHEIRLVVRGKYECFRFLRT